MSCCLLACELLDSHFKSFYMGQIPLPVHSAQLLVFIFKESLKDADSQALPPDILVGRSGVGFRDLHLTSLLPRGFHRCEI